jgi:RsiW-degrading membrane proteinase PrsW (M82 family)
MPLYFIRRGSSVSEAMDGKAIRRLCRSGKLLPSDLISCNDSGPWSSLADVRSLSEDIRHGTGKHLPEVPTNYHWYYRDDKDIKGPLSASELIQMARSGLILNSGSVRKADSDSWVQVKKVKELKHLAVEARPMSLAYQDSSGSKFGRFLEHDRSRVAVICLMALLPFFLPQNGIAVSAAGIWLMAIAVAVFLHQVRPLLTPRVELASSWAIWAFVFSLVFGSSTLFNFADVAIAAADSDHSPFDLPMWIIGGFGRAYVEATDAAVPTGYQEWIRRFLATTASVGFLEELTKLAPVLFLISATRSHNANRLAIIGVQSALGFGLAEAIWLAFVVITPANGGIGAYLARFISGPTAHALLTLVAVRVACFILPKDAHKSKLTMLIKYAIVLSLGALASGMLHAAYDVLISQGSRSAAAITMVMIVLIGATSQSGDKTR